MNLGWRSVKKMACHTAKATPSFMYHSYRHWCKKKGEIFSRCASMFRDSFGPPPTLRWTAFSPSVWRRCHKIRNRFQRTRCPDISYREVLLGRLASACRGCNHWGRGLPPVYRWLPPVASTYPSASWCSCKSTKPPAELRSPPCSRTKRQVGASFPSTETWSATTPATADQRRETPRWPSEIGSSALVGSPGCLLPACRWPHCATRRRCCTPKWRSQLRALRKMEQTTRGRG